jgi:hypothetical protein
VTTTEQPPEVAEETDFAGPIIGRRRAEDEVRTAPFTLAVYDSRNRETLHPFTARVDIDASSVFGFLNPKVSAARRVGALRDYLLRALVDDDGIGRYEEVVAVVPDPKSKSGADADYVPVDSVDHDAWRSSDVRYRVGDNTLWDSEDDAVAHARDHGSSLRRFIEIMDDDSLRIEQSALEEIVDYLGRQGSDDHPTKRPKSSSRSRSRKGR